MNSSVKKVVVGKPIEKLLKNSQLLPVDNSSVKASLERLQALRQQYIQSPQAGRSVLKLPSLQKKK